MKGVLFCSFLLVSLFSFSQDADSTNNAEEKYLQESLDKFLELSKKGIEITGDTIQVSKEFLTLLDDEEYRSEVYPDNYNWEKVVEFLSNQELNKVFWYFINLYPENEKNKEHVLRFILAYDKIMLMDDIIINTFNTYCYTDPEISIIKEDGMPEIVRPDIMESKLRDVREIVAYIHSYREQNKSIEP